ncbi:MAG: DUF6807 family protein [Planctomycetota bacterium]|jgi:hypothetical protein
MNCTTKNTVWRVIAVGFLLLWLGPRGALSEQSSYSWRQTDSSVALLNSGRVVWQLNYDKQEGRPYFHPLSLTDGTELTRLRPADHVWHRALWFSWKYVNGLNYWDPELPEGQTEVIDVKTTLGEDYSARIEMSIRYHPAKEPAVLSEERVLCVQAPGKDGSYYIDWHSTFTAGDKEVLLDRTGLPGEKNGKSYGGYAGLSLRMAEHAKNWQFLSSEGPLKPESRGNKARWVDFRGDIGGVAVFDHPDNPRHPSSWWLSGSMPYFSPAVLFEKPYTLAAAKSLELRYRILIHEGRANKDMLDKQWKAFAGSESRQQRFSKTDYSYRAMDIEALSKGFENPPIEAGQWAYWFCFDNAITAEEMEREIEEMVAAGIAGAELRFVEFAWWREKEDVDKELALVGHKRLEYLSDEFVEVLEHACSVAQRHGFKLAINMGMGWPPGGTWITDKYRTRTLKSEVTVVEGPKEVGKDVKVTVPSNAKVFAWRLKDEKEKSVHADSFVDLAGHVRFRGREGWLSWKAPEGKWLIVVFRPGFGGGLDKAYGNPADPGSKEAIDFHLNYLFDKIEPKLGKYFGTTLTEVASDSWEYDGRPYWTPTIDEMFATLHGYELAPRMYALAGYGADREKIMADVAKTQQRLVMENFYVNARRILSGHGLGHRPQAYGRGLSRDLFEVYSNCDVPEIEEGVRLPEAVWVSHTLGKPITSVEAMTFLGRHGGNVISPLVGGEQKAYGLDEPRGSWETNPAMLRWFSNAHYARGINRVQIHSFGYSPDGVPLPGWRMYAEIHLNRNVPWWRYMKHYGAWARRVQWVLQSGWPVADSLVYPIEGNPGGDHTTGHSERKPVSPMNSIDAASTYTFSRIWQSDDNRYEVKNLCLLDDIKTRQEVDKIDQMIEQGVKVTYCGVEPGQWTVSSKYEAKMVDGREEGWKKVLEKNRSVRWYAENAALTYLHRRVEGAEVYFVMNCGRAFNGQVEFNERGLIPQIWDADTGTKTVSGQWRLHDGKVRVKVRLGHLESALIVFVKGEQVLHAQECEGGEIIRDGHGKLYALIAGDQNCRVLLSDGGVRNLKAKLPAEIHLDKGWTLYARDSDGVGVEGEAEVKLEKLGSWRDISELRNYSGTATYRTAFDVGPEMLRDDLLLELDLGRIYEAAEVWLNGKRVGVSWYPPYKLDVTGHLKQGRNELRVDVANILKNCLTKGEYSHASGLLGPAKIRGVSRVLLNE